MSVAMWNCHTWPLDVSSSVKLSVLKTQCQHWGDISHSLSGYLIQKFWLIFDLGHVFCQVLELGGGVYLTAYLGASSENWTHMWSWSLHLTRYGGYIWQLIWVLHLKIWTHISSWLLHLTSYGGYIWPSWALHLKSWPAKMSCKNNITYYTWQIWALIIETLVIFSVAMWYCHSWPLDVSSNMKLLFLTTRCQ